MLRSIYFGISAAKADRMFAIPIKAGVGWLSGLRFVQLEKRQQVTNVTDQIT